MNKSFISRKYVAAIAGAIGVGGNPADMGDLQLICTTVIVCLYMIVQGLIDKSAVKT